MHIFLRPDRNRPQLYSLSNSPDALTATHAQPAVHREGDVAEDGASRLRVLDRQAPDVHLAAAGPEVLGVWVVDDQVGMALPA